jgi:methylmalonyl-CoA/ethylmalonyl-CoA epimerase
MILMTDQEIHAIGNVFTGTFSHACVVVKDIEKAIASYQVLLNSQERPRLKQTGAPEDARVTYKGLPTPTRAYQTFFTVGGLRIEILQPDENPSTWRDFVSKSGNCFHHIAYDVQDMDAALRELEKMGAPLLQTGYYNGGKYAYVDSENIFGVMLELLAAT